MSALFISDLHLDDSRPDISAQFKQFLSGPATRASSLYILGDLFEAWIGDDDDNPVADFVAEELSALAEAGVNIYFMAGNRDFLVGQAYLERAGCQLLTEPLVIELYGQQVLLLHGDSLCIDDHQYMAFRTLVRNPAWQAEFLAKPLPARRALAEQARLVSKTTAAEKPAEIMDVNAAAVAKVMSEHHVHILLHGHTHRPDVHRFDLPTGPATRIVLGDWYTQGSTLRWDENGYQLQSLERG